MIKGPIRTPFYQFVFQSQFWEISKFICFILFRIATYNVERFLLSLINPKSLKNFSSFILKSITYFSSCNSFATNVWICSSSLVITANWRQLIIFYLFLWISRRLSFISWKSVLLNFVIVLHFWVIAFQLSVFTRLRRRRLLFVDWVVKRRLLSEVVISIGLAMIETFIKISRLTKWYACYKVGLE